MSNYIISWYTFMSSFIVDIKASSNCFVYPCVIILLVDLTPLITSIGFCTVLHRMVDHNRRSNNVPQRGGVSPRVPYLWSHRHYSVPHVSQILYMRSSGSLQSLWVYDVVCSHRSVWSVFISVFASHAGSTQCQTARWEVTATAKAAWDRQVRKSEIPRRHIYNF